MSRITLKHLTFLSASGLPAASIDFGPHLTVIYGVSDTGKSYIVDSLNFMLGRRELRSLPEADGYTHILLGLELPDGTSCTIVRAPKRGGSIRLYRDDLRAISDIEADLVLSVQHSSKNTANISRFLLSELEMDGVQIRTNARNTTRGISFRDLAPLCIIDETSMQAQRSPIHPSDQYIRRTAEQSVFRFLLDRQDDSHLEEQPDLSDARKIGAGKKSMLEGLIAGLVETLRDQHSTFNQLTAQRARLANALDETSTSILQIIADRDRVVLDRQRVGEEEVSTQIRLAEVSDLIARFGLLLEKYDSDLARLAMVSEAGSLLGFFSVNRCAFCGAEPEYQDPLRHAEVEATRLAETVSIEVEKISSLRDDLAATLDDLAVQRIESRASLVELTSTLRKVDGRLRELDELLRPVRSRQSELYEMRSAVDLDLEVHRQVAKMQNMMVEVEDDLDTTRAPLSSNHPSEFALIEFSRKIGTLLSGWLVPDSDGVTFDKESNDLAIGGQPRASRGKGMRAITHAAFTIGLAEYCYERDESYPGFVVLDSPIVTYRGPESGDDELSEADEPMTETVADYFYRYLQDGFSGQAVVMENVDPPKELLDGAIGVKFTRSEVGRYGFFPVDI